MGLSPTHLHFRDGPLLSRLITHMANPLKCDLCSKPATVHLTQIVNSKIHKVDLCEACAQAKGVTDPSGFSLADLLLKASLNPEPRRGRAVRVLWVHCAGFSEARALRLPGLLRALPGPPRADAGNHAQGQRAHGQGPAARAGPQIPLRPPHPARNSTWTEAIKAERFEDAARYRDEISQVKVGGHPAGALTHEN
jgi:protein arginine kinase activator